MKNGCARFVQIKDLNTRANLCENNFHLSSIKNDNGYLQQEKICDANRTNNSINLKKGQHR